jgi:hypothetical protein
MSDELKRELLCISGFRDTLQTLARMGNSADRSISISDTSGEWGPSSVMI